MKIVKKKSAKTFKGKDGKDHNYINYYIELDNGRRVGIKCISSDDYKILDGTCVYER